mmetsp:Transcript_37701/g.119023  ORF Transcript_37701/g.119023 Transcript_37701/m.119023 type:complete len:228 (+) Transcript_37701:706-1389(+)
MTCPCWRTTTAPAPSWPCAPRAAASSGTSRRRTARRCAAWSSSWFSPRTWRSTSILSTSSARAAAWALKVRPPPTGRRPRRALSGCLPGHPWRGQALARVHTPPRTRSCVCRGPHDDPKDGVEDRGHCLRGAPARGGRAVGEHAGGGVLRAGGAGEGTGAGGVAPVRPRHHGRGQVAGGVHRVHRAAANRGLRALLARGRGAAAAPHEGGGPAPTDGMSTRLFFRRP